MKRFCVIISVLCFANITMGQCDTIVFESGKNGYEQIAQKRLETLYKKEKKEKIPYIGAPIENYRLYLYPSSFLSSRYMLNQLKVISIPILGWNQKPYRCGDNLEPLIAFKQDFLFQRVLVIAKENNIKVGEFEIYDSYNEENRKKDSIDNAQFSLHGPPVMYDRKK